MSGRDEWDDYFRDHSEPAQLSSFSSRVAEFVDLHVREKRLVVLVTVCTRIFIFLQHAELMLVEDSEHGNDNCHTCSYFEVVDDDALNTKLLSTFQSTVKETNRQKKNRTCVLSLWECTCRCRRSHVTNNRKTCFTLSLLGKILPTLPRRWKTTTRGIVIQAANLILQWRGGVGNVLPSKLNLIQYDTATYVLCCFSLNTWHSNTGIRKKYRCISACLTTVWKTCAPAQWNIAYPIISYPQQ